MDSQNTLNALNYDCLYEVVQQNCINIGDLVEIASTCTQLQAAAAQVFRIKYKEQNCARRMSRWSNEKVDRFLKLFGSYCEKFTTHFFEDPESVQPLVLKYSENLKYLGWTGNCNEGHKQLFAKLVGLEHHSGKFEGNALFDSNSPIEKMQLWNCEVELPQQLLPKLQHVILQQTKMSAENITGFCQQNPQLLSVELNQIQVTSRSTVVIDQLKNLEKLTYIVGYVSEHFLSFANLGKLKEINLKVSCDNTVDIMNALHKAKAPLESVQLVYFSIHTEVNMSDLICQFSGIKYLRFRSSMDGQDLLRIISSLPQLEDIDCESLRIKMVHIRNMLRHSNKLKSASFNVWEFDYVNEYSYLSEISAIARNSSIAVRIDMIGFVSEINFIFTPNSTLLLTF